MITSINNINGYITKLGSLEVTWEACATCLGKSRRADIVAYYTVYVLHCEASITMCGSNCCGLKLLLHCYIVVSCYHHNIFFFA